MLLDDVDLPPTKRAQHECPTCKKVFTRVQNLKQHQQIHMNVKKFQCSKRDKSFHPKSYLKRHKKQVHKKRAAQWEYKCATCRERFHNLAPFRVHQETHSKPSSKTTKCPQDHESGRKHFFCCILVRNSCKFLLTWNNTVHLSQANSRWKRLSGT